MTDTSADGSSESKRLVVVRHSKTEQFAGSDHARRLTDRGKGDAQALGAWLAGAGIVPEVVLVSSAARAQQTAELMASGLDPEPEIVVLDDLYGAGPSDVVELCGQIPADVTCAAVVGHNPTMAVLAGVLVADDGLITHFPTSAAALIDLPGPWDALAESSGTLVELYTPHDS
jgi:phosphohistidine phosphatase